MINITGTTFGEKRSHRSVLSQSGKKRSNHRILSQSGDLNHVLNIFKLI